MNILPLNQCDWSHVVGVVGALAVCVLIWLLFADIVINIANGAIW